jgi:hypothetical protein
MHRRLIAFTSALALFGSAGLVAATPVQASTGVHLLRFTQLFGMSNVVTDRLDGWLLIAGTGVTVTDLAGGPVATLLPADTMSEVQVAPDGRFAWAADTTTHALDRIDLSDLTVRAFPLPQGDAPSGVVPISSRWIVFSHSWNGDPTSGPAYGGLGVLDTTTGAVWRRPAVTGVPANPILRLIPSTRRVLDVGDSPGAAVYDFATGRPVLSGRPGPLADPCTIADLAVAPDGQTFVPACTDGTRFTEYRTADVSVRARYTIDPGHDQVPFIDSVAYSGDGSVLAVGQFGIFANNFTVFKRTATGWQGWYAKHLPYEDVTDSRGVVFSPDSTTIYVLGQYVTAKEPGQVAIETAPGLPAPAPMPTAAVTVTSPTTSYVGDSVTIAGTLRFSDTTDADAGADRPITITRVLNGIGTTLAETTDTQGGFSFPNTPTAAGTATYTVRYAGDLSHGPASASSDTAVRKHPTVLTLATTTDVAVDGFVVTATAHLGPTYTNRTVSISLENVVLASGVVDAAGNLTAVTPPQPCDFFFPCYFDIKATFSGDARYLPAEADS